MRELRPASLFTHAPLPVARLGVAERIACLRLIRSGNIGPATFRELINHFGGAEPAIAALPGLVHRTGSGRAINLISQTEAEEELARADAIGAHAVFTIEPGYPARLAAIDVPPPLLYIKGETRWLEQPMVAIVGSRSSSAAGMKLTTLFATQLGAAGVVIASGLARGIDKAAHTASLSTGTVAVLAGGLDIVYPPEHEALQREIGERGCLISEQPPGFKPRAKDFPRRNRIISGLALGVLVVEAAQRSGSLVTARFANEQGREVFAVPGSPLDPRAEGTNALIKQGATMVTAADDILTLLQPMLREPPPQTFLPTFSGVEDRPKPRQQAIASVADAASVRLVLQSLGPSPIDVDAIVRATGLPAPVVQIALLELDLGGRIVRSGHGLVARDGDTPMMRD